MATIKDFRQHLTNMLIESIEENKGLPWEKGWSNAATRPINPGTGTKYKGGNYLNLLMEQFLRGSDDPRWMTLKQANKEGYRIRKGAKAALVEYWDWGQSRAPRKAEGDEQGKPQSRTRIDEDAEEEEEPQSHKPRVFFSAVFNGCDIVGLPEIKREIDWQPNELAEKLIAATGAEIKHTAISRTSFGMVANAAYYAHGQDKIFMPPRGNFKSESDYYATVLHELAHWTGHRSRLARPTSSDEKNAYAKEELRAEIASLFLTSMVGVEGKIQNHAKYTGNWLEIFKGDKHEIFRAARDAEKIVDYIFEYAPELREVVEAHSIDNLLPKEPPKPALGSEINSDLPNFSPPQVQTDLKDPRWTALEQTVRDEARKFGVNDAAADKALGILEPQFTKIINAAPKNGYTADDINVMLTRNIIDEMRTADVRQQQWERFSEQVRQTGADLYPGEQIELALQKLGSRYQQLIAQSAQEGWTKQQTDTNIHSMIFGEKGRRPIAVEYIKTLIENSPAMSQASPDIEDDDDFVLGPLTDEDAERYIMNDAEIQDAP